MLFFLLVVFAILTSCTTEEKGVDQRAILNQAITDSKNLIKNSAIGNGEGQYPLKALTSLNTSLKSANETFESEFAQDNELLQATRTLYDACMTFETQYFTDLTEVLVDSQLTRQTRYLYHNLKQQAGNGLLFGAHDPTGYGVGWRNDNNRSDVKDVSGSYPAVFSWDFLTYFQKPEAEQDFLYRIKLGFENKAVTTICWHQLDPLNKSFYQKNVNYNVVESLLPGGHIHNLYKEKLQSIAYLAQAARSKTGNSIPIIFRPYHEHNGDWFWWGKGNCSEEQFIAIWQFTVKYLRDTCNVHNFLYSFSPDGGQFEGKEEYLWNYLGDEYVDVFGLDFYFRDENEDEKARFKSRVKEMVENAQEKNKIAAITETGNEKIEFENFFTDYLLEPLKSDEIARNAVFAVVWRNANTDHHYAPYPGHTSVENFMEFYNNNFTVFASDMTNYYILK
jgi:mannan endo-1,4-beta-mannosidase